MFTRECERCHGREGKGGPNVHIGNLDLLFNASDGFLRYAIREGRPGTLMPGFESTLGEHGVEDVLALLRRWQVRAAVEPQPPAARPPPSRSVPSLSTREGRSPSAFSLTPW